MVNSAYLPEKDGFQCVTAFTRTTVNVEQNEHIRKQLKGPKYEAYHNRGSGIAHTCPSLHDRKDRICAARRLGVNKHTNPHGEAGNSLIVSLLCGAMTLAKATVYLTSPMVQPVVQPE